MSSLWFLCPAEPVDTSEEAAASVSPEPAGTMRQRVLALLMLGDMTCEEVERSTGWAGNTVRPRLWELERMGLIVKSEGRKANASGRMARVYHFKEGR